MTSKALDDLKHEHEAILFTLVVLEKIVALINQKDPPAKKDIIDIIDFLKKFADKCHHGKEEGILFLAMIAAGIPEKGGPVGVMLTEHAAGRNLIRAMVDAM